MKTIKLSWSVKKTADSQRVGAMFCFKYCDVNQN